MNRYCVLIEGRENEVFGDAILYDPGPCTRSPPTGLPAVVAAVGDRRIDLFHVRPVPHQPPTAPNSIGQSRSATDCGMPRAKISSTRPVDAHIRGSTVGSDIRPLEEQLTSIRRIFPSSTLDVLRVVWRIVGACRRRRLRCRDSRPVQTRACRRCDSHSRNGGMVNRIFSLSGSATLRSVETVYIRRSPAAPSPVHV